MNTKDLSISELEDILRKAENTHVSGSEFEQANIELKLRRDREISDIQKAQLGTINRILALVGEKPKLVAAIAVTSTFIIGVLINLSSTFLVKLLGI